MDTQSTNDSVLRVANLPYERADDGGASKLFSAVSCLSAEHQVKYFEKMNSVEVRNLQTMQDHTSPLPLNSPSLCIKESPDP